MLLQSTCVWVGATAAESRQVGQAFASASTASVLMQTAGVFFFKAVANLYFHIITIFLTIAFTFLAVDNFEIQFGFCIKKYPTLAS